MKWFVIITVILWFFFTDWISATRLENPEKLYKVIAIYLAVWCVFWFISYIESRFDQLKKRIDEK